MYDVGCRLRKAASTAQAQVRQLKARAEVKAREAQDSLTLAQAAEQKAQALEAAGLAHAGPFSPALPGSSAANSPLPLQGSALLRGLAGGLGPAGQGWTQTPKQDTGPGPAARAAAGSPYTKDPKLRPATPLKPMENAEEQAQLLKATMYANVHHRCKFVQLQSSKAVRHTERHDVPS